MNPLEEILSHINTQRAALTGGAEAPVAAPADTGGALAPDAALADEDRMARSLRALVGRERAPKVAAALRRGGQTLGAGSVGGGVQAAAERWGGDVLGFGKGEHGQFAAVLRDGKLFHVYSDPHKNQKMDTGGIARSLGIRPKVAQLDPVGAPNPFGAFAAGHQQDDNGTGGAQAPSMSGLGALTGGALAPADGATPRGSDPLDGLRRLLHRRA